MMGEGMGWAGGLGVLRWERVWGLGQVPEGDGSVGAASEETW